MSDVHWFAVHTRPVSEFKASKHLRRQGYRTFYPFTREKRYRGRVRIMVDFDRPLFSRYIFVALTRPSQSLYDVNETYGVSTVVYLAGEPLCIPGDVIDALMRLTDDCVDAQGKSIGDLVDMQRLADYTEIKKEPHWFKGKPGDSLLLKDHAPYYGLIARLASVADLDEHGKISIFLQMLGAVREISVPAEAVAEVVAA